MLQTKTVQLDDVNYTANTESQSYRSQSYKFLAKNTSFSNLSGFRQLHLSVTIFPLVLNTLSEVKVVALTLRYFLAKVERQGSSLLWHFHIQVDFWLIITQVMTKFFLHTLFIANNFLC